jgi:hypothetical protein
MRDAIRTVTSATAFAIVAALIFTAQANATTVDQFFNHMKDDQERAYVLTMARAAEKILSDAGKPELARRVKTLFADAAKQRSDGDAIEEFLEAADAFCRQEMVREASGEKSKDGPVLVEEMMVKELLSHQIEVPPSFIAAAKAGKLKELAKPAKQDPLPAQPVASRPVPPDDDPIGSGGFITPPTSFNVMLCVPADIANDSSWSSPEAGSKMAAFKNLAASYIISIAKPSWEYWIAQGQYERFDPATTNGDQVVSEVSPESGRFDEFDPKCPSGYGAFWVQVNH